MAMKKWKNRKTRDLLGHRVTGIFCLQDIECNLHGNSSCCKGRGLTNALLPPLPCFFLSLLHSWLSRSLSPPNHALTRFLGPHGCRVGIISVLSVVFLGWRYAKKEVAIVVPSTDFLLESYNPSCTEQTFFTFSFFVHLATIPKKKSDLPVAESRAVKILAENVKENDKTDEIHEQWLLAANVLNRFFISLFLIAVIITFIAVFTEDTRRLET